nr:hypothetical protein [uncultured bacterium]
MWSRCRDKRTQTDLTGTLVWKMTLCGHNHTSAPPVGDVQHRASIVSYDHWASDIREDALLRRH